MCAAVTGGSLLWLWVLHYLDPVIHRDPKAADQLLQLLSSDGGDAADINNIQLLQIPELSQVHEFITRHMEASDTESLQVWKQLWEVAEALNIRSAVVKAEVFEFC